MLPSGGLFPFHGTELIPLFPYLRTGLLKKGRRNISIGPDNWSLLPEKGPYYGLLISSRPRQEEIFVCFCL